MKLGVVLPQFREDPHEAIAVARRAEELGLDGVFLFDHLWPIGSPDRPALHGLTLLSAVAAETGRVAVGMLVARVSLLPDAVLVHGFTTLQRMVGDRLIAGIGAGDKKSEPENLAYGIEFPSVQARLTQLAHCARLLRDEGIITWVGGLSPATRAVAAQHAQALNVWGVEAARVREVAEEMAAHGVEVNWGGQVEGDVAEVTKKLQGHADAGATWAVCAPRGPQGAERDVEMLAEVAAVLR